MKLLINILPAFALIAFLTGCGEEHQTPPLEHMELTARFIDSIANGRSEVAIRQGRKLQAIDPDAHYISELTSIQETNDTVAAIQKSVENGKIDEALQSVRAARKKHRNNRTINEIYPKISQLRNAEKLFRSLKKARSSSAMRSARIAVQSGLSLNMTPELNSFLVTYEQRGNAVAAKEKADILAAEQAAKKAARQSKIEEAERRAAEKKFEKETAEKSAEGVRLRQESQFP